MAAGFQHLNAPRGAVQAQNWVWNVSLLEWDPEIQPSSGGGGGGAVTIAAGADVTEGNTSDVAVTGDNAGTISAKLRGLNKAVADVWDQTNHALVVEGVVELGDSVHGPVHVSPPNTAPNASHNTLSVAFPANTILLDYTGGTTITYLGVATPATATSSAAWQIRKFTYDGLGNVNTIKYSAGVSDFTSIWDNRASLSYS